MGWRRSSQIPGPAHEGMQRGERDYLCVALARGICLWGGIMILNSKSRRGGERRVVLVDGPTSLGSSLEFRRSRKKE
jgi:hypothetical protein